jgi:S-phase kinase-associated protein 1
MEGEKRMVSREAAKLSGLVSVLLYDDELDDEIEVPLPVVRDTELAKIIEFCEYYTTTEPMRALPKPLRTGVLVDHVQEWYSKFTEMDSEQMNYLVNAANYMQVEPLTELMCAKMALMIKNMTPDQIRDFLQLPDDLTEEQMEEIESNNSF